MYDHLTTDGYAPAGDSDPIRQETSRELGLETFCPTQEGVQMFFDPILHKK